MALFNVAFVGVCHEVTGILTPHLGLGSDLPDPWGLPSRFSRCSASINCQILVQLKLP